MRRYDMKLLPWIGIALCALILVLLPVIVSFRYLDTAQIGMIGECVAPVLGMLILTPLAFGEDHVGRREVLGCRPTSYWHGFTARLAFSLALEILCVASFVLLARSQSLPFDEPEMGIGLLATALTFGCMGLTLGQAVRSQPISYLVPFACFLVEFFTRGRFTGRFFLLSMMEGKLCGEKLVLLGIAILVLLTNIPLSMRQVRVGANIR